MSFVDHSVPVTPPVGVTEDQVYAAIADVLDPELDESLIKLGFIDRVEVHDGEVTVTFKLPTYWCAPNFAYLMAADLRTKVSAIPGVRSTRIFLLDHCSDEEVSSGVNAGKSFLEAFPEESEDNLEELRQIFLRKGFLARQDTLLRQLQKSGLDEATVLSLRVADMHIDEESQQVSVTTASGPVRLDRAAQTAGAYLRRMAALGLAHAPHDPLFVDEHGQAIAPGGLTTYLRQTRSVRMNIMFNTVFCRDMFETRYGAKKALPEGELL